MTSLLALFHVPFLRDLMGVRMFFIHLPNPRQVLIFSNNRRKY
jgi:hypothetical protein